MGAAEAQWLQRFGAMDARDRLDLKRIRRYTQVLLGTEAAQRAWQAGSGRTLGQAVQVLLAATDS